MDCGTKISDDCKTAKIVTSWTGLTDKQVEATFYKLVGEVVTVG